MRSRFLVPAMIAITLANGAVGASSRPAGTALPSNVSANPIFRTVLDRMWLSSPTFKRQCRRVAAASQLHITLLLEELARRPSSYHARSAMKYKNGVLASVTVHLTLQSDSVELIAHEFEHVIEQLDQVDLAAHTRGGNVRKREDGAFETNRAVAVGRRVAHEVRLRIDGRPQPDITDTAARILSTVVLQDEFPLVLGPPTGRVSASGRHVVFASRAALGPPTHGGMRAIYVLDTSTGAITLESPGAGGRPANGESVHPGISRDGRFVVFESIAGNLTDRGHAPGIPRVFLRDRQTGITSLLSTNTRGEPADGASMDPAISADGDAVVFTSSASDILEGAHNPGAGAIYLIRLASKTRTRVDVTSRGLSRDGESAFPAINADGRHVAFMSRADLTPGDGSSGADAAQDMNEVFDIYVRDTVMQRTRLVSRSQGRRAGDGASYQPAISGDGRLVAFVSQASDLTQKGSTDRTAQIYLRDMETGTTELISHTLADRPGDAANARPAVSGDGSVIAYQSLASTLLCEDECGPSASDINLLWDVYVYDRSSRRTFRASSDSGDEWMETSRGPSLDDTGRVLTFTSRHPSSPRDDADDEDLFIRDLTRR